MPIPEVDYPWYIDTLKRFIAYGACGLISAATWGAVWLLMK